MGELRRYRLGLGEGYGRYDTSKKCFTPALCVFKVIRILVLKFLKLRNPNACRLMSLISLLVASSLALE